MTEERIKKLLEDFCGTYTLETTAGKKTIFLMKIPKYRLPDLVRTVAIEAREEGIDEMLGLVQSSKYFWFSDEAQKNVTAIAKRLKEKP